MLSWVMLRRCSGTSVIEDVSPLVNVDIVGKLFIGKLYKHNYTLFIDCSLIILSKVLFMFC